MLIDEIKKANIQAMKDKNANARAVFSVVMNKFMLMQINLKAQAQEMTDADTIAILQKCIKELSEEAQNYEKAGNTAQAKQILSQKEILSAFLPQMLGDDEIRKIIEALPDKSMGAVMKHFKANYNGKVDMSAVNKVLREM